MAGDRKRREHELAAAVEDGSGDAADGEDHRLDQHDAGQCHRQPAGGGIEAGGEEVHDKRGRHELAEEHDHDESGQQRGEDKVGEPPPRGLPRLARGAQQHRDHGAGEGAACNQAEERVRQAERRVVGVRLHARPELDVE